MSLTSRATMKILVIDPDAGRAAALAAALGRIDAAEISVAPDGFYALTMLERQRPDLIVAASSLKGLEPGELCEIVRSDPALAGVQVVLYEAAAPGAATELAATAATAATAAARGPESAGGRPAGHAGFDLIVGAGAPLEILAQRTRELWEIAHPPAAGASAAGGGLRAADDLSGSLGVLDLMELSQAFSLASKTGQLLLDCPRGEGCIYFDGGRVIHATIRDRGGRTAFTEILQETLRERNIAFRFQTRRSSDLAALPRTIDMTVQHLLLSFAVDFDETQES
ncbi:MAG TPA: DUF4388 domain-containing protein [Thermoanaerobaculia bacterium]|nr:DUF4388 domain-containing protein [Thermoanaerobaculia bacterium]